MHYLLQLGLSVRFNYWLVLWLTMCSYCDWHSVKLHPFIQFKWPPWEFKLSWNSCNLHDHCIVLLILYWLYRAATLYCSTIMPFSCLIVWNLLWYCVLVPVLLWRINMVSELTAGQSSFSSKTWFLMDLAWPLYCITFFIDYTEPLLLLQHHYAAFMLDCLKYLMRLFFSP